MKVYGFEITEEVQRKAMDSLNDVFKTFNLQQALEKQGVLETGVAYRGADRMVQKARKAGTIRYEGGCWHKTGAS